MAKTLAQAAVLALALTACAQSVDRSISLDPQEWKTVNVTAYCGFDTLELTINGQVFSTQENPPWTLAEGEEFLALDLIGFAEPPILVAPAGSSNYYAYRPDPNPPSCDAAPVTIE